MNTYRNQLLVTAGTRAGRMEEIGLLTLPYGFVGEIELSIFVADKVDKYINERINEPYPLYIDEALQKEYGGGMKKYISKINTETLTDHPDYEFHCYMNKECSNIQVIDEWGCAEVWCGNYGTEYNFCIQDDGTNCSSIYYMKMDPETGYADTDTDKYIHYEIDFSDDSWKWHLEKAMGEALIEFCKN